MSEGMAQRKNVGGDVSTPFSIVTGGAGRDARRHVESAPAGARRGSDVEAFAREPPRRRAAPRDHFVIVIAAVTGVPPRGMSRTVAARLPFASSSFFALRLSGTPSRRFVPGWILNFFLP